MSTTLGLARGTAMALGVALLLLASSGCAHHHYPSYGARGYHAGPPPWAPAHGTRHAGTDGTLLVFDSGVNAYLVVGHANYFLHHDHYYRYHRGRWERAGRVRGPWVAVELRALPAGLRKHHDRHFRDHRRAAERRGDQRERIVVRRGSERGALEGRREQRVEVAEKQREKAAERGNSRREKAKSRERDEERRERMRAAVDGRRAGRTGANPADLQQNPRVAAWWPGAAGDGGPAR